MTDDLDTMGVGSLVERDTSGKTDSVVDAYARVLESFIDCEEDPMRMVFPSPGLRLWISGLPGTIQAAHAAVLRLDPTTDLALQRAGLFLSQVYRQTRDRVIVYDLPIPLQSMAREFPENKLLINRGTLGMDSLRGARGIVVNEGRIEQPWFLDWGVWFINLPSGEMPVNWSRCLHSEEGFYTDLSKSAVTGYLQSRDGLDSRERVSCRWHLQLLSAPRLDEEPDIAASGLTDGLRRNYQFRDDAPATLRSWLSAIEPLVNADPEAFLDRYTTRGSVNPAESPSRLARQELFDILFEKKRRGVQ